MRLYIRGTITLVSVVVLDPVSQGPMNAHDVIPSTGIPSHGLTAGSI